MLVSPSVGEERRGIDRADERRGRGTAVGRWPRRRRVMGREGGRREGAQRWSLIAMRPSIALAPSLTHSLSADIKEMGVSKGGWSASETRLVVSHD